MLSLLDFSNIAIIRTDKLGDMMLTLPMCAEIRRLHPSAHISVIAKKLCAPLLENQPIIDAVYFVEENSLAQLLREKKFDAVFFPRPRGEEYFWAWKARIPHRIGSGYRWYSFLVNHKIFDHRSNAEFHEAEYNVRMLRPFVDVPEQLRVQLVPPNISIPSARYAAQFLSESCSAKDFFLVHPGSGGSASEWSPEYYGEAAEKIAEKTGWTPIISGSESDALQCSAAKLHSPSAINLCGKFSLQEWIAFANYAKLFVSNSTGVLHIAAALSVPVVGIYPNTPSLSARRWGPYSKNSSTISPPPTTAKLWNDRLSDVSVENVVDCAINLLHSITHNSQ